MWWACFQDLTHRVITEGFFVCLIQSVVWRCCGCCLIDLDVSQSSVHLFFIPYLFSLFPRDEIQMKSYSRTNGQPKPSLSQSPASSTPSSPSHPISVSTRPGQAYPSTAATQSPAHKPGGGVKKVTGVGGTTYEISVWVTLGESVPQPAVWSRLLRTCRNFRGA